MQYEDVAARIIDLKKADLALRDKLASTGRLNEGYDEEMKKMHNENASVLEDMMLNIGYPTTDRVGTEANDDFFN